MIFLASLLNSCTGGGVKPVPVNQPPTANPGGPYSGKVGQPVQFDGSKSSDPAGNMLNYTWNFGDNSSGTGVKPAHTYNAAGTFTVSLTVDDGRSATNSASTTATITAPAPAILDFNPKSGPSGTLINLTGSNLTPPDGTPPQINLVSRGGGTISAPISAFTATTASFVIPAGAVTGAFTVSVGTQSALSAVPLTVTASSSFALSALPTNGTLIQGQSLAYAVSLASTDGFLQLATLSVSGLPTGVTASFSPPQITAGQTSVLTVTAPAGQAAGAASLTISGSATVEGIAQSKSAAVSLNVQAVSTGFIGRTVVDDPQETPITGVTVKLLGLDDKGISTGCAGQTTSDAGGNFALLQLSAACVGPQLISYDGSTATSPAGKYAGVNLSYTLTTGQVTTSPVLIHLPRIDNAETIQVKQNSLTDQVLKFQTIPKLEVRVYAGTTFTLADGTKPDPFPLVAISIPIDRLPDLMPSSGLLTPFIVAFQPANAVSSQPVEVNYPNPLNIAPGTVATLMTLDPTHGYMVPYGTGTVSADGTEFVADPDPGYPGHGYGLVHFDWHGTAPLSGSSGPDPCKDWAYALMHSNCPASGGPVDLSSGVELGTHLDAAISGQRGGIALVRSFRTFLQAPRLPFGSVGPFGTYTSHNYAYALDTAFPLNVKIINLILPSGAQVPFSGPVGGPFLNTQSPQMRGVVMTANADESTDLRWKDGTVYHFIPISFQLGSLLSTTTDPNGNTVTLKRDATTNPPFVKILAITDSVGRSLNLSYNSAGLISSVTDPLGRVVSYAYNSQQNLVAVTNFDGGVTTYTYNNNRIATVTDPRGVVSIQNTYDSAGRVSKQVEGDGGVFTFAYTLLNPMVLVSPVIQTVVTDPRGNTTTYRFDPAGYLLDVTDPTGQKRIFTRDANHFVTSLTGSGWCPAVCGSPAAGDLSFSYDANGNLATRVDALGNSTSYTFEPTFNKLTSATDALGNSIHLTYDAKGNLIKAVNPAGKTTQFAWSPQGDLLSVTDALGNVKTLTYNSQGDLANLTDPDGNQISFGYDGVSRLMRQVLARGEFALFHYDANDNVSSVVDPLSHSSPITYDQNGNLTSVSDQAGNTTAYQYDALNRSSKRIDSANQATTFVNDPNGNVTSVTDRKGQTSTYTYDSLDRLILATQADGSTVNYKYDSAGRLVEIADSADPHGPIERTYDLAGHLLSETTALGSIRYQRDAVGRRTQMTVAGQSPVTYSWDSNSRLTSISQGTQTATILYNDIDRRTRLTLPNGVAEDYSYDANSSLTSLNYSNSAGPLGNLTYQYNPESDLTFKGGSFARTLLPNPVASATYGANNQQSSFGGKQMTYDLNGNLTSSVDSSGTTTFTWDARTRLVGIRGPSTSATFQYDGLGRRASATVDGTKTEFLYDHDDVIAEFTQGASAATYLRSLDIDEPLVRRSTKNEHYLLDGLGSVLALTDDSGKVTTSYTYDPFGQTVAAGQTSANRFQFQGRENDGSTGLYYYRARYYSPALQRFLGEDPLGLFGDLGNPNLYAFTLNDPNKYRDPLGLDEGCQDTTDNQDQIDEAKEVQKDILENQRDSFLETLYESLRELWHAEGPAVGSTALGVGNTALDGEKALYDGMGAIKKEKERAKQNYEDIQDLANNGRTRHDPQPGPKNPCRPHNPAPGAGGGSGGGVGGAPKK